MAEKQTILPNTESELEASQEVLEEITRDMPEVQEHAIEAEKEKQNGSTSLDDFGRAFDPEIHATDDEGKPKINKDGTFRKKRQSKKSKLSMPGDEPGSVSIKVGHQMAESIFNFGQLIGGEEWAPIRNEKYGVDERQQMRDAWANYAAEKSWHDFPPGVAVTMVTMAYVIPRLSMPKTKTRLQTAKEWVYAKYLLWREKRATKVREKSA